MVYEIQYCILYRHFTKLEKPSGELTMQRKYTYIGSNQSLGRVSDFFIQVEQDAMKEGIKIVNCALFLR